MMRAGTSCCLTVTRLDAQGAWLAGDFQQTILLAHYELPEPCQPGDQLDVFVYHDGAGRLVATRKEPLARLGECAFLKVVAVNFIGAFLDWGLPKDLLVPHGEQQVKMELGRRYLVKLISDPEDGRVAASSRLDALLSDSAPDSMRAGQAVDLLIAGSTELGVKAIVDHQYWGLLYHDGLYGKPQRGQRMQGFVQRVREDRRIDLMLTPPSYLAIDPLSEKILQLLRANDGFVFLSDKSSPEAIFKVLGVSKKLFKKAIGSLYKQRLIEIQDRGIKLL